MKTFMETVELIIRNHFCHNADKIRSAGNITNNYVYSFAVAKDQYYLKLYRSKGWPEEGKIPFVYQCLLRNEIFHAELIAYRRDDETYPNGYLIERKIQGTTADSLQLDKDQEKELYAKLAELVSSVHEINIENYGYIGNGIACYDSMADFLEDEFEGFKDSLADKISERQMERLKEKVIKTMHDYADLPSVLCHGDLSKKNIIVRDNGEISLIDWDDAMALNWMADVARLTLWMKQNYNEQDYALFRKVFMDHYRTSWRKADFDVFESAYHAYSALDSLLFSVRVGDKKLESSLKGFIDSYDIH